MAAPATLREPEERGDEDLVEAEGDLVEEVEPVRPANWSLQIARVDRSIFDLYQSRRRGILQLNPDFQREFVWDNHQQTRLVESVLARIPLPAFYLSEENEGETIVIDGQQRLTTIFGFIEDRFPLAQLELLPELNGKSFAHLEGKLQRRFEATYLTCFVLQPGTDSAVKFHISERLNVGGVARNAQEIRNGLFRGPGLELIKRLAANTGPGSFLDVAGPLRKFRRMKADELVLRAMAFLDLGPDKYTGETSRFLNEELQHLNHLPEKKRQELELRLSVALIRTRGVFGEHAFRRYNPTEGTWTSQINGPLLEITVCGFDKYFPPGTALSQHTAVEIERRFRRICGDSVFRDAITSATQATSRVRTRFDLWMKELADVA